MSIENRKFVNDKSLVVVGAGGNIGSHLVPHLGRMQAVGQVTLIDRDAYEPQNLRSQAITPRAVGKPKVVIQARRLRCINPELRVAAVVDSIENLPLGQLRGDLILACLDSREARRWVNQMAWRLGVPWIDAGVEPGGLLVRVEAFVPSTGGPCLECGWDDPDYALLEQTYPCGAETHGPAPTNAPASLGALAASLQAIECQKLLAGQIDRLAVGRQILLDAAYHKYYLTKFSRNPNCRFDHETWSITSSGCGPRDLTIGDALGLGSATVANAGPPVLRVEGKAFVRATACPRCGHAKKLFRLQGRLRSTDLECPHCGRGMVAVGFEMLDALEASLPAPLLARKLSRLGFRAGDVFGVDRAGGVPRYYEVSDGP